MRPRAFTLIELLVVISIIAILIGILVPALGGARDSSKTAKCLANTRSLGQALTLYCNENREVLPHWSAWQVRGGNGTGDDTPGPGWSELVEPMVSSIEAFVCPTRKLKEVPVAYFIQGRYAHAVTHQMYSSVNLARIAFTSQFVISGDANQPILFQPPYGGSAHEFPNCDPDDARWPAVFFGKGELVPHKGISNLVFLDGHAGGFKQFDAGKMTWHGTRMSNWYETFHPPRGAGS